MASTALAPIIPIPSAAPAPATASVKLPEIPPAVAAASAMSVGIILVFFLFGFLSAARSLATVPTKKVLMLRSLLVRCGELDVNGAKEHENGGLQQTHQNFQEVKGEGNRD